MKKLLFVFLFFPLILPAQKLVPRFENDTLYTTSGFKFYKGETLHFAKGTANGDYFRFIKFANENGSPKFANTSIVIKNLKDFTVSGLGNGYIKVIGTITYKDGSRGEISLNIAFDKAIESFPGLPSELIVPDEFKNKTTPARSKEDRLRELKDLFEKQLITKDDYDKARQKILEEQ